MTDLPPRRLAGNMIEMSAYSLTSSAVAILLCKFINSKLLRTFLFWPFQSAITSTLSNTDGISADNSSSLGLDAGDDFIFNCRNGLGLLSIMATRRRNNH